MAEIFSERLSEIKIGVELIVSKKKDGSTEVTMVSSFSIGPKLRHICAGVSFKQLTKSSINRIGGSGNSGGDIVS